MTHSLRVALADDESDLRGYCHKLLSRLGHQVVVVAENGRVLLEQCREARPDVVREVYRVLKESRAAAALPTGADDPSRLGIKAIRQSLEQLNTYAVRQKLIPRAFSADELFADAARILGAAAE